MRKLICAICGEEYETKFRNSKYCSEECMKEGQREKSRYWQMIWRKTHNVKKNNDDIWEIKREESADIFDRLDSIRDEIGCTWEELARGCDLSIGTMRNFTSGEHLLSLDSIIKISKYTGRTVDYILGF